MNITEHAKKALGDLASEITLEATEEGNVKILLTPDQSDFEKGHYLRQQLRTAFDKSGWKMKSGVEAWTYLPPANLFVTTADAEDTRPPLSRILATIPANYRSKLWSLAEQVSDKQVEIHYPEAMHPRDPARADLDRDVSLLQKSGFRAETITNMFGHATGWSLSAPERLFEPSTTREALKHLNVDLSRAKEAGDGSIEIGAGFGSDGIRNAVRRFPDAFNVSQVQSFGAEPSLTLSVRLVPGAVLPA